MRIIQVHKMDCKTVAEAEHALQSSWSGFPVLAVFNGIVYRLWADTETGETHEALMEVINHDHLRADVHEQWQPFESYPLALIDANTGAEVPSDMYTLHLFKLNKQGRVIGTAFTDKVDFLVANRAFMCRVAKRKGHIYSPIMGAAWGVYGYKGIVYHDGKEVFSFNRMYQAS